MIRAVLPLMARGGRALYEAGRALVVLALVIGAAVLISLGDDTDELED